MNALTVLSDCPFVNAAHPMHRTQHLPCGRVYLEGCVFFILGKKGDDTLRIKIDHGGAS